MRSGLAGAADTVVAPRNWQKERGVHDGALDLATDPSRGLPALLGRGRTLRGATATTAIFDGPLGPAATLVAAGSGPGPASLLDKGRRGPGRGSCDEVGHPGRAAGPPPAARPRHAGR